MHELKDKKYHAFISYRHADNKEQGRQWATWLHQAIETYEVPADLVGKKTERGVLIPERIYPIFRDEEELPAYADLGYSILKALDDSQLLIVVCSPRAVESTYVADEIDYFKKLGRSDLIIAAIIDGEPNASWDKGKQKTGFTIDDECFPIPLQFEYDVQGSITNNHAEPIAADFRINNTGQPQQGWTNSEAYRQYLKQQNFVDNKSVEKKVNLYQEQQHLMLLKIIAGILGVPLGELTQRDKQYQLELERSRAKRLRQWLGATAMLAIAAVGAGILAFNQREIAIQEKNIALTTQSYFLYDLSKQELNKGFADIALLLALNAAPGKYGGERPLIPGLRNQITIATNKSKLVEFPHNNVNHAKYSPDGHKVVTSSGDGTIVMWSIKTGEKLHLFTHDKNKPFASFSPDGNQLLVSSKESEAVILSVKTGDPIHIFNNEKPVIFAHFSPDGKQVLVVTSDQLATLWSVETGKKIRAFWHTDSPYYINYQSIYSHANTAFSSDGSKLLTTNAETNTVLIWDTSNNEHPIQVLKHDDSIRSVQFSPDGQKVLTYSKNSIATLWSASTGEELHVFLTVSFANFSPDGNQIITLSEYNTTSSITDNTAILWSTDTQEKLQTFKHDDRVTDAQFSPDGSQIITTSQDNTSTLWSLNGLWRKQRIFTHAEPSRSISFSPDGSQVLIAIRNTASLWSLNKMSKRLGFSDDGQYSENVFSPNGLYIIKSFEDNTAELWSVINQKKLQSFKHLYDSGAAKFSPNGDALITVPSEKSIAIWSVETGELLKTASTEGKIHYADFNTNGSKAIILWDFTISHFIIDSNTRKDQFSGFSYEPSQNQFIINKHKNMLIYKWKNSEDINIHSLQTGQKIKTIFQTGIFDSMRVSPNGQYLLTLARRAPALLWSIETGKQLYSFDQYYGIDEAVFSPDSQQLVTNTEGSKVILWSLESGKELFNLEHNGNISNISFSPDSKKVMTISNATSMLSTSSQNAVTLPNSNNAIIWSAESGERLQTLEGEISNFNIIDAKFGPLNKQVLLVYANSTMLWQVWPEDFKSYAEVNLPKNKSCLTPKQRIQYYLPELTDQQWLERNCSQFRNLNSID